MIRFISICVLSLIVMASTAAVAEVMHPGQLGFQEAASTSAARIHEFHDLLLYIITGIAVFVLLLLVFVVVRFNKRVNPKPSQFAHNVMIEVLWTVIPVVILIIIAVPSFKLLYYIDRTHEAEMTLKVTGYQWYWGYEYPDQAGVSFSSYMIPDKDLKPGQYRNLQTDNAVVLPVDTSIQILVTGNDVIHSWTVPALGVKIDAIPGRLNETWVKITKPGVYFGQCSEICGKDHSYMPVEVHAVSKEEFQKWANEKSGGKAFPPHDAANTAPVAPVNP